LEFTEAVHQIFIDCEIAYYSVTMEVFVLFSVSLVEPRTWQGSVR
jgi:hypothetical protein